MIVRRPAIDRCRATRALYLATLGAWLRDMDDARTRGLYTAALLAHWDAYEACNDVERALFTATMDRAEPAAAVHAGLN